MQLAHRVARYLVNKLVAAGLLVAGQMLLGAFAESQPSGNTTAQVKDFAERPSPRGRVEENCLAIEMIGEGREQTQAHSTRDLEAPHTKAWWASLGGQNSSFLYAQYSNGLLK